MRLLLALFLTVTVAQMKISSVSPSSGKAGTSVTITGENFAQGSFVTFGHDKAKIVSFSDTQIVVVAPKCSKGKRSVSVIKPDRTPAIAKGAFQYTE